MESKLKKDIYEIGDCILVYKKFWQYPEPCVFCLVGGNDAILFALRTSLWMFATGVKIERGIILRDDIEFTYPSYLLLDISKEQAFKFALNPNYGNEYLESIKMFDEKKNDSHLVRWLTVK